MNPSIWQRAQAVFAAAVESPPEQRQALLEAACGGDAALRREVESLLAHWSAEPDFLEQQAGLSPAAMTLAEQIQVDALVGQRIAAWEILRRIGQGGMGAVYLAQRSEGGFQQLAAIKIAAPGLDNARALLRFHEERQILAALGHPNIAGLLDGGQTADGRPWFAMPYLEGAQPLDAYCDVKRLDLHARLQLIIKICAAVQFAHQNLVVHRDLKPANILVTPQGEPMLLDFGIAKLLDRRQRGDTTQLPAQVMTPEYASPEQIGGQAITTASDVYQLGVLLYRLVCGERPYALPDTLQQLVQTVCVIEPPPPSTRVTAESAVLRQTSAERLQRVLRGDVDQIVLRALAKDPLRRYPSAEALADDLRAWQQGLPVRAQPDSLAYRSGKFVSRHRWAVAALSAAFVAVGAFAGYASYTSLRLQQQAQQIIAERDRAQASAQFLADLFAQADPTRAPLDVTARQMLEGGLELLQDESRMGPADRASVYTVVGGVYQQLGEYPAARAALNKAVQIQKIAHISNEDRAKTLLELAKVEFRLGDFSASERLARQALAYIDAAFGPDDPYRASALNQTALAVQDQGRHAEAAGLLAQAVELRRGEAGADTSQNLAASLNNLGQLYLVLRRYDAAEQAFGESLAIVERRYGVHHPYAAYLLHSRSGLFEQRGQGDLARADLLRAESIAVTSLGEDHPFLASVWLRLGELATVRGDVAAAARRHAQAWTLQQRVLPAGHPERFETARALAQSWGQTGRTGEAQALLSTQLAAASEALGEAHAATRALAELLAQLEAQASASVLNP